jgi:putative flavoprotein involved in K+ transport
VAEAKRPVTLTDILDGFIAALKQGRAQAVAEVQRLDGPEVVLADGSRLRPDAVICATGYRRGLEPLVGHLGVLRRNGVPFAYYAAEHPAAPRLCFAGRWGQFSGEIRLGPIHARRIARAAARHRAHHNREQKRPEGAGRDRRAKPRSWH